MKFSPLALATLSLCYAAETSQQVQQTRQNTAQAMTGAEGSMTNARQVQDTLNRQLQSNDVHANADRMVAYITGADSQIDNAIATVSNALAPFTGGVSKAIGNFLLGPYVQSVTNGAEVFLANMVGGAEDRMDAEMVGRLTGNYSRLVELSKSNNVDTQRLQRVVSQLSNTLPKAKRATAADLSGAHGAMTNAAQVQDTLNRQLQSNNAHANADRLVAYITGADSQIDNAIATTANALAPLTGGLSEAVAGVLLGPFVQSVTNGAEVFLANMIGGTEDRVSAELVGQLTGNYSKLASLSVKNGVDASKLQNLSQQITNTLPKSH